VSPVLLHLEKRERALQLELIRGKLYKMTPEQTFLNEHPKCSPVSQIILNEPSMEQFNFESIVSKFSFYYLGVSSPNIRIVC
jgi:hypothetical protein